jgi:[acyl-carrier-protein] S-malonyltransferase
MHDLTAALFDGHELRGAGPARFVRDNRPDIVAGHGLGDLAALVAADVLDHGDALRLAVLREQLIAHAGEGIGGGMIAICDRDATIAAAYVCERSGAQVARHDSPTRVVVAGSHEQLRRARAAAGDLDLDVDDVDAPAALHCSALSTSAAVFASVLAGVRMRPPALPVFSSVTAEPIVDPRSELARCLEQPVLWSETLRAMQTAGVSRFVESRSDHALGDLVCETLGVPGAATCASELVHA